MKIRRKSFRSMTYRVGYAMLDYENTVKLYCTSAVAGCNRRETRTRIDLSTPVRDQETQTIGLQIIGRIRFFLRFLEKILDIFFESDKKKSLSSQSIYLLLSYKNY